jgi:hypothetical protein
MKHVEYLGQVCLLHDEGPRNARVHKITTAYTPFVS